MNISLMHPIIYPTPWCRTSNIGIINISLFDPFHKFWTPMIMWDLVAKLDRAIMTKSTKICLLANNASNNLISLISDILSPLIRC